MSVQFLTVLKSCRLPMVYSHGQERMDCYAYFMEIMDS